jgi:hypothetical protein
MGPLLAIAMQLLPDLIGVLTGDQAGSAKDKITKAITDITGTDDPVQAQKKITEEPAVKVQLQKDLADIAFEETKEQNRAREAAEQIDLEFQRLEVADRERQRQEDYRQYLRDLQDRQEARGVQVKLAEDHSPLAWVAPIMAFALVLMIWYLLHGILTARDQVVNKDVFNVVLGALVTAFTTVVAYYFGSSLGSSKKDEALKSGALMTNPKQHAAGPDDESPSPGAPKEGTSGGPSGPRPTGKNSGVVGTQKSSWAVRPVSGPLSQFRAKAPVIMQKLVGDLSLKDEQAAGILGNIGHECMGFQSLQEVKPIRGGEGGWGWCQWTGPRRKAFEKWATDNDLGLSSDDANYGFLVHELQGSMAGSLNSLKQASTLEAATRVFMKSFENPLASVAGLPSRIKYANLALSEYKGG